MNDVSILVWTIIISVFDFFLVCIAFGYNVSSFEKFYERVRKCIYIFLTNLIVFSFVAGRAVLYTEYIWKSGTAEECSSWQFVNLMFSWMPFIATVASFIWSCYFFVDLFSCGSYIHNDKKAFCSLKTIKLITSFSTIEYNNYQFYYKSKDGKKIYLCFNPLVYIILCFYAHRSDRNLSKIVQRKENREKEQELYSTLISDLEKIKKENEEKSSEYFQKALDNISKIKH